MADFGFVRKRDGAALDVGAALRRSGDVLRRALPFSRILPEHDCLLVAIVDDRDYVGASAFGEAIRYFRAAGFSSVDGPGAVVLREAGITADDLAAGRAFLSAQGMLPPQ